MAKKKGFFGRAFDAISTRDEKEALEEAEKAAEEKRKLAEIAAKAAEEMTADFDEERKRAKAAEVKARRLEAELQKQRFQQMREAFKARKELLEANAFIASHTIDDDETLSHVALHYYGNATRPYWMVIYEANKDIIGDNPNIVREGQVLKIPALPDELKKE